MALRHAILAALLDSDAAGYQLAKIFNVSVANFWHAVPQQIYAELTKLENAELVIGRDVIQRGRPNKRMYSITRAGHAELSRFIRTVGRPSVIRDDLLVKVYAVRVDVGDPTALDDARSLADQLDERAIQAENKTALFDQLLAGLRAGQDEAAFLATSTHLGPYLTCLRGRAFESDNAVFASWAARVLRARVDGTPIPALSDDPRTRAPRPSP